MGGLGGLGPGGEGGWGPGGEGGLGPGGLGGLGPEVRATCQIFLQHRKVALTAWGLGDDTGSRDLDFSNLVGLDAGLQKRVRLHIATVMR